VPTSNERGRRHEIKRRYAWHARDQGHLPSKLGLPFLRVAELERLALDRYGERFPDCIPDTPDGRKLIRAVAEHLVIQRGAADPKRRVAGWCAARVRWMTERQALAVATHALNPDKRLNKGRNAHGGLQMADAEVLGGYVGLKMKTRTRLKITTIGATDCSREQRKLLRRAKQRDCKTKCRRARGQVTRSEYLANSLSRTKPWEQDGISRATWFRKRNNGQVCHPLAETSAGTAFKHSL